MSLYLTACSFVVREAVETERGLVNMPRIARGAEGDRGA